MFWALTEFVVSALVIVVAGTLLTRCADALAELTGLGRLLVGSLLLAGATSLPELMVDLNAVWLGAADLAVGDLMGSSLMNLLILAMLDLSHHSRGRLLSRLSAAHALSATASIGLTGLAAMSILLGQRTESLLLWHFSVGSLAILVAYALSLRMVFYDQKLAAAAAPHGDEVVLIPAGGLTLRKAIGGYLLGALLIVVAAPFLAHAADKLAELSGLGKTFVGTTLVAFSTSLPELVASIAALRMGAFDLAIGNIFGSNAFNMALLAPLDAVMPGSLFAAVSPNHALTAVAAIVITSVAVMGQLYQVEKRRRLVEPDALLVILLVFGMLGLLYYLR